MNKIANIQKIRNLALQIDYATDVGADFDREHAIELADLVLRALTHFTCATGIAIPDPEGDINRFTHDPDLALHRQHTRCLVCHVGLPPPYYQDTESSFSAGETYFGGRVE